jgi:hypothetical protein
MGRCAFIQGVRLRVGYFVHDLSDPAVVRRVQMLQAGGADVVLFGFRRTREPITSVAGAPALDLGRTHNARLLSRAYSVLRALVLIRRWSGRVEGADAILARNLEMLLVAHSARQKKARRATLNYELLDVHRLLVSRSPVGALLRAIEGFLLGDTALTLVSSPAFVTNYFDRWSRPVRRVRVVENRVLELSSAPRAVAANRPAGPPWRIGWYGMIRCHRSLEILRALARDAPGLVEIEIRGRPSYTEFDDFDRQVSGIPNLSYGGPYRPGDVSELYSRSHFAWCIDFFEAGLNSSWLLPNRLYESQLNGAVPIALRGVETGRWLARRGAGLLIDDPLQELLAKLCDLTPAAYLALVRATASIPQGDLISDLDDCKALVRALDGMGRAG